MDISFLNESYCESTHQILKELVNDIDFISIYNDLRDDALEVIAMEYDYVASWNRKWDLMTTRERNIWQKDFEETFNRFIELLENSPVPPESFGFPIKDNNLMNMLYLMGLYGQPESKEKYWSDMLFFESKTELLDWTIVDTLQHYKENIEHGLDEQLLSKPRDPKAKRALFIKLLSDQKFKNHHITIITRSVFNDELLDERTVRRLVKGGIDFSKL